MTGNQKSDPLIRTLIVIIIGTIAFGLLFNLFTGGGNMNHMGGMSGSGYGTSLDAFLGGILILLVKLLMVVLVIAVIVGIVVWIKNNFFKNTNPAQLIQSIKNDPILKTISVVTIAVLGIILLFALLGSLTNPGMGYGMAGSHGGMGGGFSAALSIAGLLNLLIKVLSFVLVISLILALASYLKKQYDTGAFNFMGTNAQGSQGTSPNTGAQPGDNNNNNPQ